MQISKITRKVWHRISFCLAHCFFNPTTAVMRYWDEGQRGKTAFARTMADHGLAIMIRVGSSSDNTFNLIIQKYQEMSPKPLAVIFVMERSTQNCKKFDVSEFMKTLEIVKDEYWSSTKYKGSEVRTLPVHCIVSHNFWHTDSPNNLRSSQTRLLQKNK